MREGYIRNLKSFGYNTCYAIMLPSKMSEQISSMSVTIPDFHHANVLVVGDIMLDRYWQGGTQRISPEAPVPVVNVQDMVEKPGGAANVALNIVSLTANATLMGIVGHDQAADVLESELHQAGVNSALKRLPDHKTITKLRIISLHQQLIRLDFEQPLQGMDGEIDEFEFAEKIKYVKAVVFSDYHKGGIQNITKLINIARAANIPVLIDPKGNDFTIYRGASLITPNRKEFEAVAGHFYDDRSLYEKAQALLKQYDIEAILITRGAEGMSLVAQNADIVNLPAHAHEVYDVTGAGDTVIAVMAAAIAAGCSNTQAMLLANTAAGIVVTKLGAASVSLPELRRAIRKQQANELGILTEEEALLAIQDAHAHGEKVVMTNGCFDILHAGHVSYLQQARKLGHRLLIAVNDDDSVRRLKGAKRPINTLAHRMSLLAALRCVDWVVSFNEDTPARLIELLSPDILVKGSDYQVSDIAGAQSVLQRGGEVKLIDLVKGCSTSLMIEKIQGAKA